MRLKKHGGGGEGRISLREAEINYLFVASQSSLIWRRREALGSIRPQQHCRRPGHQDWGVYISLFVEHVAIRLRVALEIHLVRVVVIECKRARTSPSASIIGEPELPENPLMMNFANPPWGSASCTTPVVYVIGMPSGCPNIYTGSFGAGTRLASFNGGFFDFEWLNVSATKTIKSLSGS